MRGATTRRTASDNAKAWKLSGFSGTKTWGDKWKRREMGGWVGGGGVVRVVEEGGGRREDRVEREGEVVVVEEEAWERR